MARNWAHRAMSTAFAVVMVLGAMVLAALADLAVTVVMAKAD